MSRSVKDISYYYTHHTHSHTHELLIKFGLLLHFREYSWKMQFQFPVYYLDIWIHISQSGGWMMWWRGMLQEERKDVVCLHIHLPAVWRTQFFLKCSKTRVDIFKGVILRNSLRSLNLSGEFDFCTSHVLIMERLSRTCCQRSIVMYMISMQLDSFSNNKALSRSCYGDTDLILTGRGWMNVHAINYCVFHICTSLRSICKDLFSFWCLTFSFSVGQWKINSSTLLQCCETIKNEKLQRKIQLDTIYHIVKHQRKNSVWK